MNRSLIFSGLIIFSALTAVAEPDPILTDLIRNRDGSLMKLNQGRADKHCRALDMRLPTSRELAEFAVRNGANAIVETEFPAVPVSDSRVREEMMLNRGHGLHAVTAQDANFKSFLLFYLDERNYKHPEPQHPDKIWSSTIKPAGSNTANVLNSDGSIGFVAVREQEAFRCAKGFPLRAGLSITCYYDAGAKQRFSIQLNPATRRPVNLADPVGISTLYMSISHGELGRLKQFAVAQTKTADLNSVTYKKGDNGPDDELEVKFTIDADGIESFTGHLVTKHARHDLLCQF